MKPDKSKYQKIFLELSQLVVSKNNPRYKSFKSEHDAINFLCCQINQANTKKLIDSFVDNGIFPDLIFFVFKNKDNKYELLDGNRRLTTFKILQNPELISNNTSLKKYCYEKQKKLKDKNIFLESEKFECCHFFNSKNCRNIIKQKHSKGTAVQPWSKYRQLMYNKQDENPAKRKTWELLISTYFNNFWNEIGDSTKKEDCLSTIERILTDSKIQKYIPTKKREGEKLEFQNIKSKYILEKIINDAKTKKIDTRGMNTKKQQEEYWNNIINDILSSNNNQYSEKEESLKKNKILKKSKLKNQNITKKNIKENKYKIGNLTYTNKKLAENKYQGILNLIKEIHFLKYYSTFNKKVNERLYKNLKISTLSLIRILYEQLLKFYLKEYHLEIFDQILKKNNNEEKKIKISSIIKKIIANITNKKTTIFNKDIDEQFINFNITTNQKSFLDDIMHNTYIFTGSIDIVEQYTSGFIYELFNFILNYSNKEMKKIK